MCLLWHTYARSLVDKEGYIQKEIKYALDKALEMPEGRIFLIPVKFEECEVPFTLSRYQWVDLTVESGYAKMMKALKFRASHLERSTVEVSKKDVEEENLTREEQERDLKEHVERKLKEKELPERQIRKTNKKPRQKLTIKKLFGNTVFLFWSIFVIGAIALIWKPFFQIISPTEEKTPQVFTTSTYTATVDVHTTSTESPKTMPTSLPTEITDAKGVSMVLVPEGEFTMGSSAREGFLECTRHYDYCYERWFEDVEPAHQVYLDAFYIDKYEVTNAQFKICVEEGGCELPRKLDTWRQPDYFTSIEFEQYPVVNVDWQQSQDYCTWRQANIPTEAQWEKAARSDDKRTYPWGEDFGCQYANYAGCREDITAVGSYKDGQSPYGAYDMVGNVREWVGDWFSETYYSISSTENPLGPQGGKFKVIRGGSYTDYVSILMAYSRYGISPDSYYSNLGFRCTKSVSP